MTAHAGHWATNLLYVAPVVLIGLVLLVQTRRERRRGPASGDDG